MGNRVSTRPRAGSLSANSTSFSVDALSSRPNGSGRSTTAESSRDDQSCLNPTIDASAPVMTFPDDGEAMHTRTIKSVSVANGHVFLGSWDHTASMWELETGDFVRSFHGHKQDIIGICTQGEWLFTCGDCVRMWDTRTGEQIAAFGSKDEHVTSTFYAAVADPVAVGLLAGAFCRGALHIYDFNAAADRYKAAQRQHQADGPKPVYGLKPVAVLDGHSAGVMGLHVGEFDGERVLASASIDKTARLWSMRRTLCLRTFTGHTEALRDCKLAGVHLFTAALDHTVRQWDLHSGACKQVFNQHGSPVRSLLVIGDVMFTAEAPVNAHSTNASHAVREFDLVTGTLRTVHTDMHSAGIFCLHAMAEVVPGRGTEMSLFTASQDCLAKRWRLRALTDAEMDGIDVKPYASDDAQSTTDAKSPVPGAKGNERTARRSQQLASQTTANLDELLPVLKETRDAEKAVRLVEDTRARIEELEECARCCVCLERPKNAAYVPCGHQSCRRCAEHFRGGACPVCRAGVTGILALYG